MLFFIEERFFKLLNSQKRCGPLALSSVCFVTKVVRSVNLRFLFLLREYSVSEIDILV